MTSIQKICDVIKRAFSIINLINASIQSTVAKAFACPPRNAIVALAKLCAANTKRVNLQIPILPNSLSDISMNAVAASKAFARAHAVTTNAKIPITTVRIAALAAKRAAKT